MARIIWKENNLVNIKVKDDLYTIGQLLRSPVMRFFNIKNTDGIWKDVDLNMVETLFEVNIGRVVLQNLAQNRIKENTVIHKDAEIEDLWIKPCVDYDFKGGYPFKGGNLIKESKDGLNSSVIKENLSMSHDIGIIEKYELTNMWGAKNLSERLLLFFEKGIKRDPLKEKIFVD